MNQAHRKTTKWINDHLKGDKKRNCETSSKGEISKEINPPSTLYNCSYCIKVFMGPKFLIKHILRRHPENLVHLHKRFLTLSKSPKDFQLSEDLLKFLKMEFSSLKVELEVFKDALTEHIGEMFKNQINSQPQVIGKCSGSNAPAISVSESQSDNFKHEILNEAKEPTQITSLAEFQSLQHKVEDLLQIFKEHLEKTASSEDKICRIVKQNMLLEFQNLLINHEQRISLEWHKNFSELKKHLQDVRTACEKNSRRIDSTGNLQELEQRFTEQIQNFLNKGMFLEKRKTSKDDKAATFSLSNSHRMKRRHRSKYTCNTQPTDDIVSLEVVKHSASDHTIEPNKEIDISLFNEPLFGTRQIFAEEAHFLVEDKLRSLNILPGQNKLSSEEYEKKMRLINSEKEILAKKYKNFSKTYTKINSYVTKLVKSKENKKLYKKLRFSDGLNGQHEEHHKIPSVNVTDPTNHLLNSSLTAEPDILQESNQLVCENVEENRNYTFNINKCSSSEFSLHNEDPEPFSRKPLKQLSVCLQDKGQRNIPSTSSKFTEQAGENFVNSHSKRSIDNLSELSSLESIILED